MNTFVFLCVVVLLHLFSQSADILTKGKVSVIEGEFFYMLIPSMGPYTCQQGQAGQWVVVM